MVLKSLPLMQAVRGALSYKPSKCSPLADHLVGPTRDHDNHKEGRQSKDRMGPTFVKILKFIQF